MKDNATKIREPCGGCSHCAAPEDDTARDGAHGWRLVGLAAGAVVLPLVLALVGALAAGGGATQRLFGAVVGLTLGVVVATVLGRWLSPAPSGCASGAPHEIDIGGKD